MNLVIDVAGRARAVTVTAAGGTMVVTVDGRPFTVDPRRLGPGAISLLVSENGGPARSVDASVLARPGHDGYDVGIGGRRVAASIVSGFGRRNGAAGPEGQGPQRVLAPMPGKIVRVLVAPGDEVQPRQGLVVVEAMKMENELRAVRAGRVKDVLVSEGQSVDAGVLLVTVE